jgi:hypothetical protein
MRTRLFPFLLFVVLFVGMLGSNPTIGLAQSGTPTAVPTAAIDVKDTWDLAAIYPNDAAWEKDFFTDTRRVSPAIQKL